jgi:hypothetical protein
MIANRHLQLAAVEHATQKIGTSSRGVHPGQSWRSYSSDTPQEISSFTHKAHFLARPILASRCAAIAHNILTLRDSWSWALVVGIGIGLSLGTLVCLTL